MLTHYLQGHKFKDAWKIFLQQFFYIEIVHIIVFIQSKTVTVYEQP